MGRVFVALSPGVEVVLEGCVGVACFGGGSI